MSGQGDPRIRLELPFAGESASSLRAGDRVLLGGIVYTARDAAHKRLAEALAAGGKLPVDLRGQTIYYTGPTPARPGEVIGSAGPTTSGRMDAYTPALLAHGLKGMIGKGYRSAAVKEAIMAHKAVYFGAVGGAGALIATCVRSVEEIAYGDLGPESIKRLTIRDFPAVVLIDSAGNDWYALSQHKYGEVQ